MNRKKCLCLLLAAVWTLSFCIPEVHAEEEYDYVIENCYNYANQGWDDKLTSDVYYCYDDFVEQMDESTYGSFLTENMETLSNVSYTPDVEDYMEALSTVIALEDTQNGSDPTVQQNFDHLKDTQSYINDFGNLCLDALDNYTGNYGTELEKQIMGFGEFAINSTEHTAQMIQAMANIQKQVEDYAAYDRMLAHIEHHSDGDLKTAAQLMRQNMDKLMEYNMGNAAALMSEGVFEMEESIFSCIDEDFYNWLDDQALKDDLKWLEKVHSLKEAFDLGTDGALLMGNLVLGTENVADRIVELQVLDELDGVLAEVVDELQYNYLLSYENGCADRDAANEYIEMLRHLLNTRRRGEYCLYSTIMEDSNVLSWFFGSEEVEEWYRKLTDFLNDQQWLVERIAVDPEVLAIHYYRVFDGVASTWEEAAAYCESLGGHLATIGSQTENDYVYSIVRAAGYESAYFGLTDSGSEGTWRTANGEPVVFWNWGGREPNNEGKDEHYAMFYYKYGDGKWNDGDFGGSTSRGGTAFICEWDVDPDTFDTSTLGPKE